MIILESDGITIKRTIDSLEYVRIDTDGYISFWGQPQPCEFPQTGRRLEHRKAEKPFCEFDINECRDLLKELDIKMKVGV